MATRTPAKTAAKKAATPKKPTTAPRTVPDGALNPKQRRFVVEYLKDNNATQAYVRAYGASPKSAETAGPRLLGDVRVKAEIVRLQDQALARVQIDTGISLERTLKEIARIAYFDPRRMFGQDGRPLPIAELDDDTAAVIAGLDVLEEWDGAGQDRVLRGYVKKWKLADKKGALDMLMKHLGGYKEDNKQRTDPLAEMLEGMRRSTMPVNPTPTDE